MLYSQARGIAQQVPNTNGAFFRTGKNVEGEVSDEIAQGAQVDLFEIPPAPNQVVAVKAIVVGVSAATGQSLYNEYTGAVTFDENGQVVSNKFGLVTNPQNLPDLELGSRSVQIGGGPADKIVVSVTAAQAIADWFYWSYITWAAIVFPFDVNP